MLLLDRYEVIRSVGSGGFGETFLGRDTHLPSCRECAIKRLKLEDRDPEIQKLAKQRFYREAAVLEQLGRGKDQIPSLYQYSESEGGFYLVQEWIDGVTLREKVRLEGKLNESSVIEILIGVLTVLDYVHGEGIIHRDIKPENIILRSVDGLPVLIDFGAVKEELKTVSINNNQKSRTMAIGTPGYVAGEQLAGRPVYSSDLYGLGLTAVFLLTGKNPNDLFDLTTSKFAWRNEVLNVSFQFGEILDKAIEDEAKNRYSTAKEMLAELVSYQSGNAGVSKSQILISATSKLPSNNLTPSQRRRLERERNDLEIPYNLLSEKLGRLRKAIAVETNPAVQFQLDTQIEETRVELDKLELQIDDLEKQLD